VRRTLAGLTLACVLAAPSAAGAQAPDAGTGPLGRLNWGLDGAGQPWTAQELRDPSSLPPAITRETARLLQVARDGLDQPITPVQALHTEGTVFSDPSYKASVAATSQLSLVYAWATCARIGQPPLSEQCTARAGDAIEAWTTTYQPSGNPINENALIPLLQSIDLMLPLLPPDRQVTALSWTADLEKQGEALFATFPAKDTRLLNNWQSWRLCIAGLSAVITGDTDLQARVRDQVRQHIAQNIYADGSTEDFHARDALHYHVYDLEPLVELDLFTSLVDPADEAAILRGLQFLQPFVSGQQQHLEFAHSTVPFDARRREAGDPTFAPAPWKPASARTLLRLARIRFPDIRPWASSGNDESYAPRIKELAALLGG
jgi:hypothetical protein